jgi:3-oxoacyl-[acyl-carrier-protein] synthase II
LGNSLDAFADGLIAGRSGVGRVADFAVADHPSQVAGQVTTVPCPPDHDPVEFAELHRLEKLVRWCCIGALRDAGWWGPRREVRIGLILGVGAEWHEVWETDALGGGAKICQSGALDESILRRTMRRLELSGPCLSVSAACASGNYALAQARDWLELGWVDVCLAGACDMAVTPMSLATFGNLRALTRRNDYPAAASRPFDRGRDGFVLAEGGAVFVLEPAAAARRRGAAVYAEAAGFGFSSDAYNMVIPSPDPGPAAAAVRQALADAGVGADEVDYVNAHATSTPVGDAGEARVLHAVFGDAVKRTPVSSTKSMTGHLLSAAAAVEALACVAAMKRGVLPPTINLDDPDPECDLCHVANEARPATVRVAASNSFGFGGSNTCLVLKAV